MSVRASWDCTAVFASARDSSPGRAREHSCAEEFFASARECQKAPKRATLQQYHYCFRPSFTHGCFPMLPVAFFAADAADITPPKKYQATTPGFLRELVDSWAHTGAHGYSRTLNDAHWRNTGAPGRPRRLKQVLQGALFAGVSVFSQALTDARRSWKKTFTGVPMHSRYFFVTTCKISRALTGCRERWRRGGGRYLRPLRGAFGTEI